MDRFTSCLTFSFQIRLILIGFVLVLLTLPFQAFSQKETETFSATNAVYVEVGGSSGRYAVNYSKIFHQKGKIKLNASAGFTMWHHRINSKTTWLPAIPLEFSGFWGKSNHHLEVGLGLFTYLERVPVIKSGSFEVTDKVGFSAGMSTRLGYRYQKPEGGFFFRIAYTPIIDTPLGGGEGWFFYPYWAGVSFGKSF